jgi:hypothetical protein
MNDLKWAIVEEIENLGYTPEVFTNPKGKPGLASSRAWGARDADEVAQSSEWLVGIFRMAMDSRHGSLPNSTTTKEP